MAARHKWLVLDIETAPSPDAVRPGFTVSAPGNYKDPEKIAAYVEAKKRELEEKWEDGLALRPFTGELYALGVAYPGHGDEVSYETHFGDEADLLELAAGYCTGSELVFGHNIHRFDLPFLGWRLAKHGMHIPYILQPGANGYYPRNVYDPMTFYRRAYNEFVSLDALAEFFGLDKKPLPDGETSAKDYARWDREKQIEYLEHDLRTTVEVGGRLGILE